MHEGAVEADFHRFYGIELHRTWGTRSLGWLVVRIKHLPPESATWTAYRESKATDDSRMSIRDFVKYARGRIRGGD